MILRTLLLILPLTAFAFTLAAAPFSGDDDEWAALRRELLDRPRRVFYNTDGCDAVYYPADKPRTPDEFKKERLAHTEGTETAVLSYCVTGGGFGHVLYDSKVAHLYLADPDDSAKPVINITRELIRQGTNPVQLAQEYCREHNLEFFACLRMNDTHDMVHRPDHPSIFWSPFKDEHPDALFGRWDSRPSFCSWSAVDYGHPAVQDYLADLTAELATRFDVDGFEFDFMRHAQLFRSVACGGTASQAELDTATAVMRRLRAATEAAGKAKGRPILVSIRVPDSVEYCRAIGIDIERWLQEGLVDMLITASYFQLNPWSYTAGLAHRYGVKAYASLDESRIAGSLPIGYRNSVQTYQGMVLGALAQGMDGIYLFNMEYGGLASRAFASQEALRCRSRLYYATYRGSGGYQPGFYLSTGEKYNNLPRIEPGNPAPIAPGGSLEIPVFIGEELQDEEAQARSPIVTVQLRSPSHCDFRVEANGVLLKQDAAATADDIYTYEMPAKALRFGENRFTVTPVAVSAQEHPEIQAKGDTLLVGRARGEWRRFYESEKDAESIVDGAYCLKDTTSDNITAASLYHPLPANPGGGLRVRVSLKLVEADCADGAVIRIANGEYAEKISFEPGKVTLAFAGKSAPFDTTGDFHSYDALMKDGRFVLLADGRELLSAPLAAKVTDSRYDMSGYSEPLPEVNSRGIVIGSVTGPGKGTLCWKDLTVLQDCVKVADFAVGITYREALSPELAALATAEILPVCQVAVTDGAMHPGKGVSVKYPAGAIVPDEEAVLLMHRRQQGGFPHLDLADAMPLAQPPPFLVADFTLRVLEDGPKGESGCLFNLAPPRPGQPGNAWELDLRFSTKGVVCQALPGKVDCSGIDFSKDNTYRVAMNTATGETAVWGNGKLLVNGVVTMGLGRKKPFCYFGDASGSVNGVVRFLGLVVGIPATVGKNQSTSTKEDQMETSRNAQILIDARTPEEYASGHIEGALLLPYDKTQAEIAGMVPDKNARILVYCRSGRRSGIAKETMEALGYTDVTNLGSMQDAAAKTNLPIVK